LLLPPYGLRENEDVSLIPEHETGKPQRFELKQRPLMSALKRMPNSNVIKFTSRARNRPQFLNVMLRYEITPRLNGGKEARGGRNLFSARRQISSHLPYTFEDIRDKEALSGFAARDHKWCR
jgi:hypothetical protein